MHFQYSSKEPTINILASCLVSVISLPSTIGRDIMIILIIKLCSNAFPEISTVAVKEVVKHFSVKSSVLLHN